MQPPDICTKTMARMYARQGYYEKAIQVLEQLIQSEPDREDLRQALADVERRKALAAKPDPRKAAALFRRWTDLMLKYRRFKRLKTLQERLEGEKG